MSEPDDILAMFGPLPELPDLWTGWAASMAQVEEVVRAYTESSQLPPTHLAIPPTAQGRPRKRGGKIPKSPPSPSDPLG